LFFGVKKEKNTPRSVPYFGPSFFRKKLLAQGLPVLLEVRLEIFFLKNKKKARPPREGCCAG
jgi:hypothetical protein